MLPADRLAQLTEAGVAVWLDDLSRRRLTSGNLADLIRNRHVVGVTSNPTTFAKALGDGEDYAEQLSRLAARRADVDEAVREITTDDVREAADVLHDVWVDTGGRDGRVSIEVDPGLAYDTAGTVAQVRELWDRVGRPNVFVKIPATAEGLPAITRSLAAGISVNVTLTFSVRRYREVVAAFMAGLEQAAEGGHDLSRITSVASFFVSRVDTEADNRLADIGGADALQLRGNAAIANARLAYAAHQEEFATPRWEALRRLGAAPQRPLWASTGVKNPDYPDTLYVTELVAPGVVNTMPEATLHAFADHGVVRGDVVTGTADAAAEVVERLADVGVDLEDVCAMLERQGVQQFAVSWDQVRQTVAEQLGHARV
jgi:transaldolase